ncbi:MAG: DUF47 family protein [Clostridia bacterium]|nr:DUF47 family protein [Clostridia bacterium]
MKQSRDQYYFDTMNSTANFGKKAALYLQDTLASFNIATFEQKVEEMHAIEHEADTLKHDMTERLSKEFMTPIELEDLVALSHELDNVVDCIDDVMQRIYIYNITAMREDVAPLCALLVHCTDSLCKAVKELANFRKSATIRKEIVEVNNLESDGDALYMKAIRSLYTTEKDPIAVLAWTNLYDGLENCFDACEHASDVIESVIMKNS